MNPDTSYMKASKTPVNRRDAIKAGTAALVAAAIPDLGQATMSTLVAPRLFEISLAQWSLHRTLFSGQLDNLDFAQVARGKYRINVVEYVNQFFADKGGDEKYLKEMRKRSRGSGVKNLLIMVDGEGALGDASERKRREVVANHHKWVDAARILGCLSIRVNAQSSGTYEEQIQRAADGLRRLTEYAVKVNINVIVENHGGLSSNGKWLAEVIKNVDHSRCGTLPDFGNFHLGGGKWYDRYEGVREMMPYAKAVSAKSHEFDEEGNETSTDYRRMLRIVMDGGYHGHIGIEYEGQTLSEPEGIMATKKLLEKVRDELAMEKNPSDK